MGWLILLALGSVAMGVLVLLGVPRRLWSLGGAALMLAGVGYALQGSPMLTASPATTARQAAVDDPGLIELRERMFGRFTADGAYLIAADALTRAGEPRSAVRVILGGIRGAPDSAQLWTGLGTTLATHDNTVSPPARFAFDQARRLAPQHPGPPFFAGLAEIRAGNFAAARPLWARALALTPTGASYRPAIAGRLRLLDAYLVQVDG